MVQALILAAGRGTRMGAYTDQMPKCMVPLAGKPLIQWQIDTFLKVGISNITVITGYCREQVVVKNAECLFYSDWEYTNMIGTLEYAYQVLGSKETIVSYGDSVFHSSIIKSILRSFRDIVLPYDEQWRLLWEGRFTDPLVDAESFRLTEEGMISDIGKKVEDINDIMGQFMGIFKLTINGWQQIAEYLNTLDFLTKQKISTTFLLSQLIIRGMSIQGLPIAGKWCEVDQIKDVKYYEKAINQRAHWTHDWRG